jgi:protein phosphatase
MSTDSWQPGAASAQDIFNKLEEAFKEGNRRICESVVTRGEWRGMGTTIVALVASGDRVLIGHVGDSRAYLLRGGRLMQLTNDHSWVSEQVRLGLLTDEEAHKHPMRNIITRALGNRDELEVDVTQESFLPGDIFLLCSDGLSSMLSDEEIRQTLSEQSQEPEKACRKLVDQANDRGGDDNITVIVLVGSAAN